MSNGEFQEKYVHFNVIPKSDEFDQRRFSQLLVQKIAPQHATNILHETGLTSPQEHPPFDKQECEPLAHTSLATTHPFPKSNITPGQDVLQPHSTSTPGQTPVLQQNHVQSSLQQSKDNPPTDLVVQYLQQQTLNESQLNNILHSILNNQQSLQRETISMKNEMWERHEN